jgi:succinate dehydrogenase / fumarate reductase iron-sulfur subunit
MSWQVNFRIFRYKQDGSPARFETFTLTVRPDEYVLDAIERIWAEQDRSLVFRHACHHAGCGACGIRINGREKLGCITRIDSVATDGSTVTLEPLRNMEVISDLVVDMAPFYAKMEQTQFVMIRESEPMINLETLQPVTVKDKFNRFENCIECGICVSACPIPATDSDYMGPAALAAIERMVQEPRLNVNLQTLIALADCEHGLWRCHTAFECSEACPSNVDPAALMMDLRRKVIADRIKRLFGIRQSVSLVDAQSGR